MLAHLLLALFFWIVAHNSTTPHLPVHPVQVQLITSPSVQKKEVTHHKAPHKKKLVKKKVHSKRPKKVVKQPTIKKQIKVKHKVKHKSKRKAAKVRPKPKEPSFDPFAPQQSSSDTTAAKPHKQKRKQMVAPHTSQRLTRGMTNQEINRYITRIQRQVQNQWKVPAKSPRQINDPEVLLKLNRDGSIAQITISTPSGDPRMDQSLLKAVRAAAPFDLPANNFDLFRINSITFHPLH
ncbi:MAG: TonB family protein [Mariprofundales bacterium]